MSDRQRVSRREPVRGKEETPADVAFATLVAVYPQAGGRERKRNLVQEC